MDTKTALIWFRQDLRLHDNPALLHAIDEGYHIIPVFILDDKNAGEWKRGAASRWWLHQSLEALNESLKGKMVFREGDATRIIPELIKETGAKAAFWNRCYEPWRIKRDKDIKETLREQDIEAQSFNAALLWEPWEVLKKDGTPYQVFTPFYRKGCLQTREPDAAKPAPKDIPLADTDVPSGNLAELSLMPAIQWYKEMDSLWTPGEQGALQRLDDFLNDGLNGYKEGRDRPDRDNVSRLSPNLHFGEISPRTVWHKIRQAGIAEGWETDMDHFCSEMGWREFSTYLLYHFPDIPRDPLREKYKAVPWTWNEDYIERWQKGVTGIPIVDAGMRQLWQTGWMHNRVRMIVASLLVKNMLVHWHAGEDWFWDCLLDADLANNSASWQWVAGCGADAAPYFRIFNPVTQGEKFDPDGTYVRRYVPELEHLDNKHIHKPWTAPTPPEGYPPPIVDLKQSREAALAAYGTMKS
jgi:deoxyribodipyrimidine photo-lyase